VKVSYKQGDGVSYDETGIYVAGNLVAVYRKRSEWYGNLGRRGVRYHYFDVFRLGDDPTRRTQREKLGTGSTRKEAVSEGLVHLAYDDGNLVRPDLVEAAYVVDADHAKFVEGRLGS
jgi:hypothetical protein